LFFLVENVLYRLVRTCNHSNLFYHQNNECFLIFFLIFSVFFHLLINFFYLFFFQNTLSGFCFQEILCEFKLFNSNLQIKIEFEYSINNCTNDLRSLFVFHIKMNTWSIQNVGNEYPGKSNQPFCLRDHHSNILFIFVTFFNRFRKRINKTSNTIQFNSLIFQNHTVLL